MYSKYATAAAVLTAVLPLCSAQTYTNCNPLSATCPADPGLASSTYSVDFTQSSSLDQWKITAGSVPISAQGAEFTVAKEGDAPTIETDFYFFFGTVEVVMQAAPGTGIVSSIVMESDDLDEIDWEALGGDTTQIETNYFGKGDTSTYDRATYVGVNSPQTTTHTYTVDWTPQQITWSVDGAVVRTLAYNDAQGGTRFPQTPMTLRIGVWAGGDPNNGEGTIEWAGGLTNYGAGPFTMYIKSVTITNANPAQSYTYSGNSGSYTSIEHNGASSGSSGSSSGTTTAAPAPTTTTSSSSSSEAAPTSSTTSSATTLVTSTSTASSTTESSSSSNLTPTTSATSTPSGSTSTSSKSTASSTPTASLAVAPNGAATTSFTGSVMILGLIVAILGI